MNKHYFLLLLFLFGLLLPTDSHAIPLGQHGDALTSLASDFLTPHNEARESMGMVPLEWDLKLTRYAQEYANERIYDCDLIHSTGPYGENIFWGGGSGWKPWQAVQAWMEEREYYDYESNSCAPDEDCGHYTQCVWESTRRIGCAIVTCLEGKGVFVTCNYDPPGNYDGERPY